MAVINQRERARFIWAMAEDGRSHEDIAAIFRLQVESIPNKIKLGERLDAVPPDWDKRMQKPEPVGKRLDNLVVTVHAFERWHERIPDNIDMLTEYRYAVAVSPKRRKTIARHCPVSARKYMGDFAGRYYLESRRSNIVFVMQQPAIMITVFCL